MNKTVIQRGLISCDERIAIVQEKLNQWKVYNNILNIVNLDIESKYQDKINNFENITMVAIFAP